MHGIKVVFFDMGNTLLHFHHVKTDGEKNEQGLIYLTEYLNRFNSKITFSEVKDEFFNSWMEGIKDRRVVFKEYPIEGFLNDFLSKYNIKLNLDECIEAINLFYTEYRKDVFFEDNIVDILRCIKDKGYKIGVISNTCYYDEVIEECFKKAGIYELIDNFTFSYSLKIAKPNIEIFKIAISKMNINASESIMIGDNLKSDIKPALELGMKTMWFNKDNKKIKYEINPNIEINSLTEILKYI